MIPDCSFSGTPVEADVAHGTDFGMPRERAGHRGCNDAWKAFERRNLLKPELKNRQKQ